MKGVPPEKVEPFSQEEKLEEIQQTVSEGQLSVFDDINDSMIDKEVVEARLQQAIETEKPKKKRKSIITNLIFLVINICVMGFIINMALGEANGVPLSQIIKTQGKQLWWLVGGVLLFALMFFADTMIFYCLIKKSTGKKRFGLAYKTSAIGKYFDAITPFSVGGQPAQILTLTKAGMSPGVATSIPIIKFIIYNIVYTLVILSFLIFGIPFLPIESHLVEFFKIFLKFFAYIGLAFTAIISVVFILIGSGKIVGRSVVRWIVRFGYKLRIVKDYRKTYNKVMNQVLEYQTSIQYLRKNKGTLIASICFCLLETLAYFAIPFTVVMAFTSSPIISFSAGVTMLFICIIKFMVCQMASVVIPLPGGTGMMEVAFAILFGGPAMIGNYFAYGLLAWRFLTYYFTIIQGFTVSTVDSVVRMIKAKKNSNNENKEQIVENNKE